MSNDGDPKPETVVDPTTGRPILMAPQRRKRPMHTGSKPVEKPCPFCGGNEAETPPEVDAERDSGNADQPGWVARAIPNKYPANLHHEVIAEGAEHREHPADLDRATWQRAIALWQRRMRAIESRDGIACAYLFKNVGARAGASIAHNHSQVLGLAELPPRIQLERQQQRTLGHCPWCRTLSTAKYDGRLIYENDTIAILAPEPTKMPFETWLLPKQCTSDFFASDLAAIADGMHVWFTALAHALDRPPCNLWLHRIPAPLLDEGESFHWHFELQPRTGQLAGLELGGDMYINSVPARLTAERLRTGLPDIA